MEITKTAGPLQPDQTEAMLSAAAITGGARMEFGATPHAQAGVTSETRTTSFWSSSELLVACDASLVGVASLFPEDGIAADISAAAIVGNLYRQHRLTCFA